jgi:hypothetical protein
MKIKTQAAVAVVIWLFALGRAGRGWHCKTANGAERQRRGWPNRFEEWALGDDRPWFQCGRR